MSKQINIIDRVKNFKDICAIAGVDIKDYQVTDGMTVRERRNIYVDKIHLIAEVLNEGVELSWWGDPKQYKWMPWFRPKKDSSFIFTGSLYGSATSPIGCKFASEELADFAGETFLREYTDYFNAI